MSSYSNLYNSYQYGSNNGGKGDMNNNFTSTQKPVQRPPPPPPGYMEASYDWNNQGASSTTGFNNRQLSNSGLSTDATSVYSSSHEYPLHSNELPTSLSGYCRVSQPQEDKLEGTGLKSLGYTSSLSSAAQDTPDQSAYNTSRHDNRNPYQAQSRTVSQTNTPQTSNHTSFGGGGWTRDFNSQSQNLSFTSQSHSTSDTHPAQHTVNNALGQQPTMNTLPQISRQQQHNTQPRLDSLSRPQQWHNNQQNPPVSHSIPTTSTMRSHAHTPFSYNTSAQSTTYQTTTNTQVTPTSISYTQPDSQPDRPAMLPTSSATETTASNQISPPNVQFINPSELYNQQYDLSTERAKATDAEAEAAARQRQEAVAATQAQAEAAVVTAVADQNAAAAADSTDPTKKKPVKKRGPKKKANGKAPATEPEAQDGGDDMAKEMQPVFERLRGIRAKNPTLFSKLWDDIKKAPVENEQASTSTNPRPSAAGTVTESPSSVVNTTPGSASREQGLPQSHLIDGMPDLGRFPAQRRRRKGKNVENNAALVTEANAIPLNQVPESSSAREQLAPLTVTAPVSGNQSTSNPTQPAAQDATWPASTQQRLACAASEYLAKDPANLGKQCSPESLMLLLRNNPSYPELCLHLESRGLILDRQGLARYLLAAVPALASDSNASQESKKAERNVSTPHQTGQSPASGPTPTQSIQQQEGVPQPTLPVATSTAHIDPKSKPEPQQKENPQTVGPVPLQNPPQPPRADILVPDGGVTSSVPLAAPKRKASSSRPKPGVQTASTPAVLGPKAEKAKKRLFSEIVDLSFVSSDEEDELSGDEEFPSRPSKMSRLENTSFSHQASQAAFGQNIIDIDSDSPQPSNEERLGLPVAGDPHNAEPNLKDFDPDDERFLQSLKRFPRIAQSIQPSAALQRVYYNPKTVARDILIAAGRHPSERPLNYHLAKFPAIFFGVNSKIDFETFRWDLVDPGGPSMPVVAAEDILAEPPRVPRKRRRKQTSREDTKDGPTRTSDSSVVPPLPPQSSSSSSHLSTPQQKTPLTPMAGAPTSGRGSGRRGRPPGAKNKNPTKAALKAAAAGSAKKGAAAAAPARSAVPEPSYPVFTCEWSTCPAQLHDVHTFERHIGKVHLVGQTSCQWNGCPNANTEYTGDSLRDHVHRAHVQPLAWKFGDGPAVNRTDIAPDRYLNANGSIVTPDAATAGESDSLIYPIESKSSIKAFYKVHGTEKPEERAREVLLAVRRRQKRVGIGLEQQGCEFSNPKRNKVFVNDEEYYQVVPEEGAEGDNWFQRDDSY